MFIDFIVWSIVFVRFEMMNSLLEDKGWVGDGHPDGFLEEQRSTILVTSAHLHDAFIGLCLLSQNAWPASYIT